jgi:Spy/CpxP family protein refolding chaperone
MTSARNTLLRWTTVLSLSLFLVGGVLAQETTTPAGAMGTTQTAKTAAKGKKGQKGKKGRQTPLLQAINSLTLTTDQKAKITPLTDKFKEETKDKTITPQVRRQKSQQLQKDVLAILTPEQQTKLRVAMAKVNGPMVGAMRELNLTPEQRTKVTPIVQKASEDIAKLNGDTSIKGKEKREKIQAIVKTAVTDIKAKGDLTDGQKTKLDTAAATIGQRKNAKGAKKPATTPAATAVK